MDILTTIADNQALFDEVKKIVRAQFLEDDARTDAISDELLGQMYRARIVGLQKVEQAFKEIATHRTKYDLARKGRNPAR